MSVRLSLAEVHVPLAMRRRALSELMRRAARAFGTEAPDIEALPFEELLRRFAAFTNEQADRLAATPEEAARAGVRLRAEAKEFGESLRRTLGVATRAEAMRAARLLYGLLGVDLKASLTGSITVRSCAFSATWGCHTCTLMAAMDEGLFAGLAGEGHLEFSTRITEGAGACVAFFTFDDERR